MTSQTLPLNLIPKGVCPRLYVSQYDKGQEWNFDIYAGTEAYTIPSGASVKIQGTKPDKTGFQYACSFSGNRVTATEQQQMTIIAGEVPAEIRIEKNNEIIATLNFIIAVEKAALADDTLISETDLPLIEEAIEVLGHADELVSQIQGYATTAQNAASTATTKASQASTSATSASNSATTASNAATTATNKASEATSAASTATTKAGEASTSATSAAGSASTATAKAQEAAASAAAAAQSAAHLTIDSTMSTTSENALQNKVVTSAIQNLSNYVANTGVKNLNAMPYTLPANYVWKGITWKVNNDGTVNVSGTATENSEIQLHQRVITSSNFLYLKFGKYKFSCPGVVANTIDARIATTKNNAYSLICEAPENGSVEFTLSNTTSDYVSDGKVLVAVYLRVMSGKTVNTTLYPMICDASISTDNTYEPYAMTNQQLTKETVGLIDNQNVNGAVNMLPNNATSQTINSVVWTVNSDGTIQAYVPSGTTLSAESNLMILSPEELNALLSKYGEIKVVGCPAGGSDVPGGYGIRCKQGTRYPRDNGNGIVLKSSDGTVIIGLSCNLRESVTGPKTLLFKPMIGLTSTPDFDYAHYVPYAKSNKELTEDVDSFDNQFSSTNSAFVADPEYLTKTGIYAVQNRSTMPTTDRWMVIHLNYAGGWCFQFAICLAGSSPGGLGKMACRRWDSNTRPITSTWSFMN